jgi:acylaminoacyl-peptidase
MFFMLGAKDRRVPPPDGMQYLAALRGRCAVAVVPACLPACLPATLLPRSHSLTLPTHTHTHTHTRTHDSGVVTAPPRVVTFPDDTHGLDKPQTEFEQWLSVVWWLRTHGCQ